MAEGRDPTPENIERARRELERGARRRSSVRSPDAPTGAVQTARSSAGYLHGAAGFGRLLGGLQDRGHVARRTARPSRTSDRRPRRPAAASIARPNAWTGSHGTTGTTRTPRLPGEDRLLARRGRRRVDRQGERADRAVGVPGQHVGHVIAARPSRRPRSPGRGSAAPGPARAGRRSHRPPRLRRHGEAPNGLPGVKIEPTWSTRPSIQPPCATAASATNSSISGMKPPGEEHHRRQVALARPPPRSRRPRRR